MDVYVLTVGLDWFHRKKNKQPKIILDAGYDTIKHLPSYQMELAA